MDAILKQEGAVHGVIFLAAVGAVAILLPQPAWPWRLLLPLLAYAAIVLAWPRLRRTVPRPAVGRLFGWPLAVAWPGCTAPGNRVILAGGGRNGRLAAR